MGHSEASGEDAGELNDAFCAGSNALSVILRGAQYPMLGLHFGQLIKTFPLQSFEIGQMTE